MNNRDQWNANRRAKYASDPAHREQCKSAARGRSKYKRREERLYLSFGIGFKDYEALMFEQDGACAICRTRKPGGNGNHFYLDHCHATGKIRGLLCNSCNMGLGKFGDDPENLDRAAYYLVSNSDLNFMVPSKIKANRVKNAK